MGRKKKRRESLLKGRKLRRRGRKIKHVARLCLNCNDSFVARGLYNRICKKCKKLQSHVYAEDDITIGGGRSKGSSAASRRTNANAYGDGNFG